MSNFPTSIDSFGTLQDANPLHNVLAAHQNDRASAIVATQTKVGADGDALSATTVEGRLKYQEAGGLKRTTVASADPLTLSDSYQIFRVTGTTDFDTIAAPSYARWVLLEFDDVLTVAHGTGNISLAGGVDLTTAEDTVLLLEWNGTDWLQTNGATSVGGLTGFAPPAVVLGTAAAAGSATTAIRSDSTILAFDATAPTTQAMGDSAATGSAAVAARRDHKHAMPAFATTSDIADTAATESAGSAATVPRGDHVHALGAHSHTTGSGTGGPMTADEHASFSEYAEIAAPSTPASGKARLYVKSDGKAYLKDDAGTETDLTAGATTLDHDHTGSAGGGGKLTADVHDSYMVLEEVAAPSAPASDTIRVYAKDSGGVTELFYKNSAGTERDLGAAAAGSLASHDHTSAGGDGGILTNDEHDGYGEYAEIATPSNPASNKLRVYAKDVSGTTKLATLDSSGTETVMGSSNTPPSVRVYASGTQNISNATTTALTFDSERWDTDSSHYTSSAALTGTVSKTASSTTLTGSGTSFTTELSVGQVIDVPGTATERKVVTNITDNTTLTVASAFANTASGQTATRVNSVLVARTAGKYLVQGQVELAAGTTGVRHAQIYHNSVGATGTLLALIQDNAPSAATWRSDVTTLADLAQWDWVELYVRHTQGSTLATANSPNGTNEFMMQWLGA